MNIPFIYDEMKPLAKIAVFAAVYGFIPVFISGNPLTIASFFALQMSGLIMQFYLLATNQFWKEEPDFADYNDDGSLRDDDE